jgi:hypothetical protein
VTITLHRPTAQAPPDPWWTCPTWCAGGQSCYGGQRFNFDGHIVTTDRVHEGALVDVTSDAHDGSAPQRIRLTASRSDDPDNGPGEVAVVLHVEAVNRPTHLDPGDVAALLYGMSDGDKNTLLAHYLAGAFAAQSAWMTEDAARAIVAAITREVA